MRRRTLNRLLAMMLDEGARFSDYGAVPYDDSDAAARANVEAWSKLNLFAFREGMRVEIDGRFRMGDAATAVRPMTFIGGR